MYIHISFISFLLFKQFIFYFICINIKNIKKKILNTNEIKNKNSTQII